MEIYMFDGETKEYIGAEDALLDPLETKKQGKPVYLLPANAVFDRPPIAEGGKADDGHDPADGGPVQITAGNQDKHDADEPVDAHVDQYRGGAQHAQVIAGGAAGGTDCGRLRGPWGQKLHAGPVYGQSGRDPGL